MALTNCPDCSTVVSNQATNCMKCGRPIRFYTCLKQIQTGLAVVIENTFVLATTGFLGIIAKFIVMVSKDADVLNKLSWNDFVRCLISESGVFVVAAYMILGIGIKTKLINWKVITKECSPLAYAVLTVSVGIILLNLTH